MFLQDELLTLIDKIYEAGLSECPHDRISKLINKPFKGEVTNIIEQSAATLEGYVLGSSGQDPFYVEQFQKHFAAMNPWVKGFSLNTGVGEILIGEKSIAQRDLERTEFYNDYMKKQNFHHWAGMIVSYKGLSGRIFSISRSKKTGQLTDKEKAVFGRLSKHIVRSLQVSERMAEADLKSRSLFSAVNRLSDGVLLLGGDLEVIEANDAARRIIAASDGLTVKRKRLVIANSNVNARLTKLLSALRSPQLDTAATEIGNLICVPRPSEKTPFVLTASPLSLAAEQLDSGAASVPAVIVFIKDPSLVKIPTALLEEAWQLTKSEVKVAGRLLDGMELSQIAKEMFISMNTVRTHLKHILDKSYTHRQAEFIATAYKSTIGSFID